MALATSMTLHTDAGETENVSFVPVSKANNAVTYGTTFFVSSELRKNITLAYSPRSASRPTDKIRCDFNYPYGTVVDGVTQAVDTARVRIDVTIPDNVPLADRDDIANMLVGLAKQDSLLNMIKTGEGVW